MDTLFIKTTLNKSIAIEPKYINNKLNDHIIQKLKERYEGKCSKNGYIKPNSIKIIKRSAGTILTNQFNGQALYNIIFTVDICNPLEGVIIEVEITNINKMGILANIPHLDDSPLNILLARQHHIDNESFSNLNIGDIVNIKILGKRFEYGESQISIIAVLSSDEEPDNNQ